MNRKAWLTLAGVGAIGLGLAVGAERWPGAVDEAGSGPEAGAAIRLVAPAHAGGGDTPPVAEAARTVAD